LTKKIPLSQGEKSVRTLLNEVIKEIDQRRHKKKAEPLRQRKPKKKVIYDDFGAPIQEIWE